ncbi:hypothetical protein ITI46_06035 [Streptomyces oryzae]|uniref:4Fe-4S Wbl-type domain-containing protein n=1 Tax=Streptomyces oryzae TaxID=1434886 RepID=A0ABS3X7B1_9ACTN|nr:hypothetical protein [Streptomyces oryzae]MBO8191252.1 hypothetical protein [Streptomyces oryzae]
MRTTKSAHSAHRHHEAPENDAAASPDGPDVSAEQTGPVVEDEMYEGLRVKCPECRQAIAVFTHEEKLPRHGLCASPWDPFGLTVCQGSGRPVRDATPWDTETRERAVSELLTLPEGLDWRTQPFSHAGLPGNRQDRAVGAGAE